MVPVVYLMEPRANHPASSMPVFLPMVNFFQLSEYVMITLAPRAFM